MGVRRVGVEEELLLVDPGTGHLRPVAQRALRAHQDEAAIDAADVEPEFFRQQIETMTEPCARLDDLIVQLRGGRRTVCELAQGVGAAAVAMPTSILVDGDAGDGDVTREPRYERIREEFGELARTSLVCAMHVHVEVADTDEGVRAIDGIRPWLPVLLAVSANSPYFRGRDTGYAELADPGLVPLASQRNR